jgi:hypothetical protein
MSELSRREFLGAAAAVTGAAVVGTALPAGAAPGTGTFAISSMW